MARLCGQKLSWSLVAFLGVTLMAVTPVVAQGGPTDATVDPDDVADEDTDSYEEMLRLSAEGNKLYEEGRLAEAAETYEKAYEAYPQPILLKNEMIARYLLEECEDAVGLGEGFLETESGSEEDIEDVEAVLGECSLELAEAAMAEEDWGGVQDWLDFGEAYWFEESLREDGEALRAELDEEIEDDDAQAVEPIEPGSLDTKTIAGWSLATVGVASLVSATVWYIQAEGQYRELEQLLADVEAGRAEEEEFEGRRQDLSESYERSRWAVPTLYGIGGVATLAGVGLLLMPIFQGDDGEGAMIYPSVGPDRAGAVFTISF